MPLPAERSRWLPDDIASAFDRYRLNEAIWLNDSGELQKILGGGAQNSPEGRRFSEFLKRRGLGLNLLRRWNWARTTPTDEKRTDLPVPIGAALVDLSAAMLMSEPPMFRIVERDEATGQRKTAKRSATRDRLDMIAGSDDARMTMLEGAQVAAAIGGTLLKAQWDTNDRDRESVWFSAVGADCAIPEFDAAGTLTAATLWTEYAGAGEKVLRHFERHSVGLIEHALYEGTPQSVGKIVPLDRIPVGASLLALPNTTRTGNILNLPTGITRLTVAFWRNRAARGWRRNGSLMFLGRSDFELVEPLLDAYSEAWGSLMRDIRLGKARAAVPQGTIERMGAAGTGGVFDADREFFLEVGSGVQDSDGKTKLVEVVQPEIRFEQHLGTLAGLKLEILDEVGWSLSSYGQPIGGRQAAAGGTTATEVVDRTTKSERTRSEKGLYFAEPANRFMRMLMELDEVLYPGKGGTADLGELSIDFPDVSQVDPEKQAREFTDLRTVKLISIEQAIRERRPNWDDDEVQRELDKIAADMEAEQPPAVDPATIGRTGDVPPGAPVDDESAPPEPPARAKAAPKGAK